MNNDQVKLALKYLANHWPGDMHPDMATTFGVEIAELDFAQVMAVLRDLMLNGGDFRPSIATVLRPFKSDALGQASEDFKKVLGVIWKADWNERYAALSPRAAETVRRLDGWATVGQWQSDQRHHQLREFTKVWDEVTEADVAKRLRSIASPASPLVASLTGAKSVKPEPVAELPEPEPPKPRPSRDFMDGLTEQFKAMLKGGE